MTSQPVSVSDITPATRWFRVAVLTLYASFVYALVGSFAPGDRPTWMPWTWLLGWHTVSVVLVLGGILPVLRAWKINFFVFILVTMHAILIALPFFWLMPRLYIPLQPTYYGVATVYDDTYPSSKVDQARDFEAGLYTKDCLIQKRRGWAKNPTKLSDMQLVPFLTSQVGEAYGFFYRTCEAGYRSPRSSSENVTQAVITGPFVVLELLIRALWGWFLPLLAAQVAFFLWKREIIWESQL